MQSFINPTPPKHKSKEATLSSLERLSLVETIVSEHYVSDLFSDQSQQQDKFVQEWVAQQSSVDAGNLQEQANANNGIRFDNIHIGEEEEKLGDDEEIDEFVSRSDERKATAANHFQNSTIARRQWGTQE
jgi:hypothetical protein